MARRQLTVGLVTLMICLVAGCSDPYDSTAPTSSGPAISCEGLLDRIVALDRRGQRGNGHDELSLTIEALSDRGCPRQWKVFADYMSAHAMAGQFGEDLCVELRGYILARAIRLLEDEGLCRTAPDTRDRARSSGASGGTRLGDFLASTQADAQAAGSLSWEHAIDNIGESHRVCGPLAGVGSSQDDVFLNIGHDYPDPSRFTIVVWDAGGIEPVPSASTVCATGPIINYQGVAQIHVGSLAAVEVYR